MLSVKINCHVNTLKQVYDSFTNFFLYPCKCQSGLLVSKTIVDSHIILYQTFLVFHFWNMKKIILLYKNWHNFWSMVCSNDSFNNHLKIIADKNLSQNSWTNELKNHLAVTIFQSLSCFSLMHVIYEKLGPEIGTIWQHICCALQV